MLITSLLLALSSLSTGTPLASADTLRWTPHRVYHVASGAFSDLESLALAASKVDAVFLGEQHDDPGTHAMQRAILESVARRRNDVMLSLEMFERDVQLSMDAYVRDVISEDSMLAVSRPWPRYDTDYRPLVEFARVKGWSIVAANVPRPIAAAVARGGLDTLTAFDPRLYGREISCPDDRYRTNFFGAMGGHPSGADSAEAERRMQRYYLSQCVKDETMAESIVIARNATGGSRLVVHVNGSFHSDYGDGTAERVRRRLPDAKTLVVTAVPVADLDDLDPAKDRGRADWIIYTLKP